MKLIFFHVYLIVPTEVNGKAIELKVKGVWTMLSIREIYCVTCGLSYHEYLTRLLKTLCSKE